MRAIKVNYRTADNQPTSTTISGAIAEFYAQSLGVNMTDFVKNNSLDKKNYEKKIRDLVQAVVNEQREKAYQCDLELNKNFIEKMILQKAKHLYIEKALSDKQLDLI